MKLYNLTIKEASDKLKNGEISSVELVQSCLDRIGEMEPKINAFITVTSDLALSQAEEVDKLRKQGNDLPRLAGIPFSLKDAYVVKDVKTTSGSKILGNYVGHYDATVYRKLRENYAVLIGKVNQDPFGFGGSTEYSAYGITRNPIDPERVPGGSSGGSGAAVAYGGGLFSIGEDTGGSIRCPAAFCGLNGLKVTYGRVSRYGSIAYASSFDTVGPMTKTSEDTAIVLSAIAGEDKYDATSSFEPVPDYTEGLSQELTGKVIGIPQEYFGEGLDPEVKEVLNKAIKRYEKLGCKIEEVSLKLTEYAIAVYYVVGLSEASSNLARYQGLRYGLQEDAESWEELMIKTRGSGFSEEEKRRIMVGTYALSAGYADEFYKKGQKVRTLLKEEFNEVFKKVDVLLTPTMPSLPYKIGERMDDPLKMWLMDAYTVTINPVGIPGLSVSAGVSKEGLPVGMQLIGPHFSEGLLLNFGYQFERDDL